MYRMFSSKIAIRSFYEITVIIRISEKQTPLCRYIANKVFYLNDKQIRDK